MTMYGMGTPSITCTPVSYTAMIAGWFREDGHQPVETEVTGTEDLGHATPPNGGLKLVAATKEPWLRHVVNCSSQS